MRLHNPCLLGVSVLGTNQCGSMKVGTDQCGLPSRGPESSNHGYIIYDFSAFQNVEQSM